jgi:V-type H+-transporting ATPase proteolipid subunit
MVLALLAAGAGEDATGDDTPFFFAYMGVASALVFANLGAAYGTAKAGVGIASLGVIDSSKIFKALIPIIMAGILGIYGLIVSVLLNGNASKAADADKPGMGYKLLGAGLSCGLSSLASGLAIGVAGDAGVRAFAQSDGIFVGMILILIFAEAIGLYGFIVAILIN